MCIIKLKCAKFWIKKSYILQKEINEMQDSNYEALSKIFSKVYLDNKNNVPYEEI